MEFQRHILLSEYMYKFLGKIYSFAWIWMLFMALKKKKIWMFLTCMTINWSNLKIRTPGVTKQLKEKQNKSMYEKYLHYNVSLHARKPQWWNTSSLCAVRLCKLDFFTNLLRLDQSTYGVNRTAVHYLSCKWSPQKFIAS